MVWLGGASRQPEEIAITALLDEPAPEISTDRLAQLLADGWGVTAQRYGELPSERDLNVMIDRAWVLKVSNPAEESRIVEMETLALAHASLADPDLPLPRTLPTREGTATMVVLDDRGRPCLARMISVLPGAMVEGAPISESLATQVGAVTARTALALSGFFHPSADRELDWDVRRLPQVLAATRAAGVLDAEQDARFVALAERLQPAIDRSRLLPSSVQHADITLTNVLVDDGQVTGIIDFGDMHHTAYVWDLVAALVSVVRNTGPVVETAAGPLDTWRLTAAVLRGYQAHRLLSADEVDVLGDLVLARLCVSFLISQRRLALHADNQEYIGQYDEDTVRVLGELTALSPDELRERMQHLAGTADPSGAAGEAERTRPLTGAPGVPEAEGPVTEPAEGSGADLPARRARAMGGPLSPLFYRRPLHIVRGEGPWLFTDDGRRLLDAYNNVAVIGHAHPALTQGVAGQLARVNTHSRYLHDGIVTLAERLIATMPPEIDTCLFTTSGTEANELAWRMATEMTGGDAAIVARHAYHGTTKWMADLSPVEWPSGHAPTNVARYEAPHGPAEALTHDEAARRVEAAAAELAERSHRPALVLADPGFTSEGVQDAPDAYLAGLVEGAHRAGALFVADEVQIGYGRTGPQLWRFARAGITPDFVTLGKPMGAGYPMGALLTRRDIADRLASRYAYFSTFAATPAAAAAGNAVLDVLAAERLPERALVVGEQLRAGLAALRERHHALGQIRGVGLIAGVDLTSIRAGQTDRELAGEVLDGLNRRGVMAGLTGAGGTVLKVRPPLAWDSEHAELFCATLDEVLGSLPG